MPPKTSGSLPDLDLLRIVDTEVQEHVAKQRFAPAREAAAQRASLGLCDLAVTELACGQYESAISRLRDASNLSPQNQVAFHNLVAMLLRRRQLRGNNLEALTDFVLDRWTAVPWVQLYRRLLYMPRFVNLEFVGGKCNLKCRMCLARNAAGYPNRLSYIEPEVFEQLALAIPTIGGFTLSAGNSDPLLHPQIERIVEIARTHQMKLDFYTNGHALAARNCRCIVDSQIVQTINFSIDAATPVTYRRIRGADLGRLIPKIEMLQAMKKERGREAPYVALSFVAMADNIAELPDFVRMAHRLQARRVLVEDLIGWGSGSGGNHLATDHPQCFEFVRKAASAATEVGIRIDLPERLGRGLCEVRPPQACRPTKDPAERRPDALARADEGAARVEALSQEASASVAAEDPVPDDPSASAAEPPAAEKLLHCGWLRGVWMRLNGQLDPCCLVHAVADMGNINDGPLIGSDKYARVKDLLMAGKVFEACVNQRMCRFVQQQRAAGTPLRIITREELGDLHPDHARSERERQPGQPAHA